MFGMRFDIDSHYGLTKKIPPLLALLQTHNVKATFFCVMGMDPSISEIVKLRLLASRVKKSAPSIHPSNKHQTKPKNRLSPFRNLPKVIHTLTYPRHVGCAHHNLLKAISDAGHEVYPHGWSHIQWQRNIDHIDVRKHLELCVEEHQKIFGSAPIGFGSPGRIYNDSALALFDEYDFLFVGDMDGDKPFTYQNYKAMQIPVTLFKTISELAAGGLESDGIVDCYFNHITENEFSNIYEHPDNLHTFELDVLDKLFTKLADAVIPSHTFSEIYKQYSH